MSETPGEIVVFAPDLLLRQQIVGGLEALGFAARGAASEARLARALAESHPAAILVELDGLGVDGPAQVARLKADPATAAIPVAGFCAHTKTDLIDSARAAGADRVVSRGELTRRLGQIAGEITGAAPAA